jgi:hypothetical protein
MIVVMFYLLKECCYETDPKELNADNRLTFLISSQLGGNAGYATAFTPDIPTFYQKYISEDRLAHTACCINSNSDEHCKKFYELRPIGTCENSPVYRLGKFMINLSYLLFMINLSYLLFMINLSNLLFITKRKSYSSR